MGEEWCRQKLANLKIEENRLDTLKEIRNHLEHVPTVEAWESSNFLTSSAILECIGENTESEQSKIAQEILTICMSSLNLDSNDSSQILEHSLRSNNTKVRAITLNEILRLLRKNPRTQIFSNDLILSVISCLDCLETDVGAVAVDILSMILIDTYNNPNIQSSFLQRLNGRDIIRCRVYEISVNLAKSSSGMMMKVQPILDRLLAELDGDDILFLSNVLELLVSLAEQNHGLVYLENKAVFEKISRRVEHIDQNPIDQFLVPGFMKFFGKIAYNQPQKIIGGYPLMVQKLFDCLSSGDVTILPVAFDTLGNLAHSSQGKILLETNYSNQLKQTFESFRTYLRNLPTDLKNRAFNTLEMIFKTEGEVSNQISIITKSWCETLTESKDLYFLLEFCRNPFPDIKVSCFSFIKTLCHYNWGVIALRDTAGFVEYLLDRRVEFDKDARFVKYEIIRILSETTVFDVQTLLQLKKYVEDGVYYVEGIVEVAVEGS